MNKNLLILDDDLVSLANLEKNLNQASYTTVTLDSVDKAETALAEGYRPDLVILDVNMPHRDGLELTDRLNSLDHIPFILLTGYFDAEIVKQAGSRGALGYMGKPIDVQRLIPAIELAITRAIELRSLKATVLQLQKALSNERGIAEAIGITMIQHRLNRKEAFELLRKTARDHRKKLANITQEIIESAERMSLSKQ